MACNRIRTFFPLSILSASNAPFLWSKLIISKEVFDFAKFLYGSEYVCGHNIFNHDLKYIQNALIDAGLDDTNIIDTLFLSPLLFPAKPYHKLLKDDKLQTEDTNNPLNDSIQVKDLFFDRLVPFAIGSRFGDNTKLLLRAIENARRSTKFLFPSIFVD